MQVNKANTYACNTAIPNSKPTKINNKPSGNTWKINNKPLEDNIIQVKLATIFNKVCPDVILAKSRIDKVKTLIM